MTQTTERCFYNLYFKCNDSFKYAGQVEANPADEPPNVRDVSFGDIVIDPVVLRVHFSDFYQDQCVNITYLAKMKFSKTAIADYHVFTQNMATPDILLPSFIRMS